MAQELEGRGIHRRPKWMKRVSRVQWCQMQIKSRAAWRWIDGESMGRAGPPHCTQISDRKRLMGGKIYFGLYDLDGSASAYHRCGTAWWTFWGSMWQGEEHVAEAPHILTDLLVRKGSVDVNLFFLFLPSFLFSLGLLPMGWCHLISYISLEMSSKLFPEVCVWDDSKTCPLKWKLITAIIPEATLVSED